MNLQVANTKCLVFVVNYKHKVELPQVLKRLSEIHQSSEVPFDILVVDDASGDGSAELARDMGYRVKIHPKNSGVGAAIRTGLRTAYDEGYEYVGMLSGNGKMHPEEVLKVLMPIHQGEADYVQGSRFLEQGRSLGLSTFRSAAIPVFSLLVSFLLGKRFTDITCGYRAYRVDWLFDERKKPKHLNLFQDWLNRYELEFYVHTYACWNKLRIKEVPVTIQYTHLPEGRKSYIKPITGWWSMLRPFVFLALRIKR
jgi:dolichol-phosphate mannosyltransferase